MQKLRRKKFGEILIAEGMITHDILHEALEVQKQTGETVGEILLRESVISETDIIRCISTQYQLPFLRPLQYDRDASLLDVLGADILYPNRLLPLERIGGSVIACMAEIPDDALEKKVSEKLEADLFYYIAPVGEVEQVLVQHFNLTQEQVIAYDERRRDRNRIGRSVGATVPSGTVPNGPPGGGSWESIFDQAENNL